MSGESLVTIAALLVVAFALWFLVYRIIWSPFTVYFTLEEGGAQDNAAGYNSFAERVSVVIFTDVWLLAGFIWSLVIESYYTVRDNPQVFIGLFLIMGTSIVVATYDSEILEAIDVVWHDVIFPAYDDVIRPLLVAFRNLYNVLIPWYNLFMAYIPDTLIFTVELFVECDLATWQESIDTFADIFVVTAEELAFWTVRVVNNEGASFNFFRVIKSITAFFETLIDKFGCLCYELSWLWCIAFDIVDADSLAVSIDQALNFFLCFLDIILDWIIMLITVDFNNNPIPNFTPAFDKLCNSTDAFGEWVVVITQTVVQEFITDENVIPDFSCLIGSPLCSVVKVAQAFFDLLSNEFDVIRDIEANGTITYLLDKFEYNQVFDELLDTGQCIADVTSFWNVTILNLIGRALNYTVATATLLAKLPVDWTFELFAIGPTCFFDPPSSLAQCAETYLEFIQDYPFDPILNAARNASENAFGVLGLINADFACAGDNFTNAVILAINITIQLVLHPDLVFTSASFWRTLPFNEIFINLENAFRCLGALIKSFASDPDGCPPHVVNFQSGDDDDDDEQVNFWCCTGNTIEGFGVAIIGLSQMLFDVILDLIEDVGVEELAQDAFDTFTFIIVPNLEIGLDNLACIPLTIFEDLTCPSGGFYNFDDDDDSANTQVGEALEAWSITFINITLIPAKVFEIVLAAFLADVSDCDKQCEEMLNEFVCPSCDISDSSQGVVGCIIVGIVDALLLPFINNLQGMGAVAGCFLDGKSTSAQDFFRGAARILTSLVNDVDTVVVPLLTCTYDFWADIFRGDFSSLPGDIVNCWNKIMSTLFVKILNLIFIEFPDELLDSLEVIVCDIPGISEICKLKKDSMPGNETAVQTYMKKFDWNGNTVCDRIIQNYPHYVELGLEAVARAAVSHCVTLRVLADRVNTLTPWDGIPLVDEDIFYNPTHVLEFMTELPKGVQAFQTWRESVEYLDVHENVWRDSWAPNGTHPHLQKEIRDLDYHLYQEGIRSRGVITLFNGITDFFNRISNMMIRARGGDKEHSTALLNKYKMKLFEETQQRSVVRALRYTPKKAVKRQLQLEDSREEMQARSSAFASSILSNMSSLLQPRSPRAIRNRATLSRFTKRVKQAWQVTFVEHPRYQQPHQRRSPRDTCGFPGQSCSDSGDCCPGLVCVDHDNKGKICSTDLCAALFDDDDDGSRFDCEDVCELQCTGCNWLRDVFCEVYLSRSAEVVFRVATGQFPCLNATATPVPTPIPSPLIDNTPPNSFAWQVFTWITRNIFGISDKRLIDLINEIGNFVTNTNVDPDDGSVGLAGTIVGFFFCEYSELSACSGPGLEEGLFITFPIYLVITVVLSFVYPSTGWLLDMVWMTYIPVLLVVSYEVGYFCFLRMLPAPNLPENLADDILSFADSVFTPFINWNAFLPGLLMVMGNTRTFKSCSRLVGFVNWSDNFVFLLQWQLPSVANFLRTTDYFALRWFRELPFLDDSFAKPQLNFSGSPPDAETSCFYYTSLNWAGIFFVVAVGALFIVFAVLVGYLIVITLLAILTWIAYLGIETARQTRVARMT